MSRPVAIVTGASSGIGEAFCRLLAADHDLVLVARRREKLETLALEFAGEGRAHRVVALDLAQAGAPAALLAEVPACDVLVNNAGFGLLARLATAEPARIAELLELNIGSLTLLARAYLPGMLERRRGGILNVASIGGFLPTPGMAAYSASKAYVVSFSEALHEEVRGTGVRVSCLCPGPTDSEFSSTAGVDLTGYRGLDRLVFQGAGTVARAGLSGLRRNKAVLVPGLLNKLTLFFAPLVPRRLLVWLAGRTMAPPR